MTSLCRCKSPLQVIRLRRFWRHVQILCLEHLFRCIFPVFCIEVTCDYINMFLSNVLLCYCVYIKLQTIYIYIYKTLAFLHLVCQQLVRIAFRDCYVDEMILQMHFSAVCKVSKQTQIFAKQSLNKMEIKHYRP